MAEHAETLDALKLAAVTRIREALTLGAGDCDVTPDGRPHPDAGQVFVAVHGGQCSSGSAHALDEVCSFAVTITQRTGETPFDRLKSEGKALARKVKAALHMSYETCAHATAADAEVVFTEPPRFEGMSDPRPVGPDHFFAEDPEDALTGLATEVRFKGARRVRYLEDMAST